MTGYDGLPWVQPGDLVARFVAQGVVVQAVDGALHVTPADALTPADREVLAVNESSIRHVLEPAAVVL